MINDWGAVLNKYKKISEEFICFGNNYIKELEEIKNKISELREKKVKKDKKNKNLTQ